MDSAFTLCAPQSTKSQLRKICAWCYKTLGQRHGELCYECYCDAHGLFTYGEQ